METFFRVEHKNEEVYHVDTRPCYNVGVLTRESQVNEIDLLAQLVESEAGNQNLYGKRLVVDVVLNRVDSDIFPDTIEEVIYQENQFSVIKDGAFDRAYGNASEESYEAVQLELEERLNYDVLFFCRWKSKYMVNDSFKEQDHWFGW